MARLVIELKDEDHKKIKRLARRSGMTIKKYVLKALKV